MYAPASDYIPQCVSDRRPLMVWAVVAAGALLVTMLIVGAPLAKANGFSALSFTIYQAFSYVCHQLPDRSFFLAGYPLTVCARCTGVYFGFAAAVLSYPLITSLKRTQAPERKWLFIAAVPLVIDFGLGLVGVWENTHWSRFLTAALLGIVSVFYVIPTLVDLALRSKTQNPNVTVAAISQVSLDAPSDYSSPHRRI